MSGPEHRPLLNAALSQLKAYWVDLRHHEPLNFEDAQELRVLISLLQDALKKGELI